MGENFGDFVTTFQGGLARTLIVTATAGNVATSLSPGIGKRWLVLRGQVKLTCDATVANRIVSMYKTDTSSTYAVNLWFSEAIVATVILIAIFAEFLYKSATGNLGASTGATMEYYGVQPFIVSGTDKLVINVGAGVAGDSYIGNIDVLEINNA